MAVRHIPRITPDEYLDREEISQTRHMYSAGVVTAMAGGSLAHGMLAMNLGAELRAALRGRGCRVVGSDVLFRTGSGEMYTYPDVMVLCGPIETVEGRPHVMTNPVFVAEILSPATEGIDRGVKSREYRAQRLDSSVRADFAGAGVGGDSHSGRSGILADRRDPRPGCGLRVFGTRLPDRDGGAVRRRPGEIGAGYSLKSSRRRRVCTRLTGTSVCFLSSMRNW